MELHMSIAPKGDVQEPWSGWIADVMYDAEASKKNILGLPLIKKCSDRAQASATDLRKLFCWRIFILQIPQTLQ